MKKHRTLPPVDSLFLGRADFTRRDSIGDVHMDHCGYTPENSEPCRCDTAPAADEDCRYPQTCHCASCGDVRLP